MFTMRSGKANKSGCASALNLFVKDAALAKIYLPIDEMLDPAALKAFAGRSIKMFFVRWAVVANALDIA
jgi:hypothetical protein